MRRQRSFRVFRDGVVLSLRPHNNIVEKQKPSKTKPIRFLGKKRVLLPLKAQEEVEVRSVLIRPVLSDSRNHN